MITVRLKLLFIIQIDIEKPILYMLLSEKTYFNSGNRIFLFSFDDSLVPTF